MASPPVQKSKDFFDAARCNVLEKNGTNLVEMIDIGEQRSMPKPPSNPPNQPTSNADSFDEIQPLSHKEAVSLKAVERYVVKELTPEQEIRFEAHYFECPECAHAVTLEQSRRYLPGEADVAARRLQPWWHRFGLPTILIPATAALLGIVAFQNVFTIPTLKTQLAELSAPQPNTEITAHEVQMGAENGDLVATPSFTVDIPLHSEVTYDHYLVTLSPPGRPPFVQIFPKPLNDRLSLHLTRQAFLPGSYDVLVCGLNKPNTNACQSQTRQFHFNIRKGE